MIRRFWAWLKLMLREPNDDNSYDTWTGKPDA